MNCLEIPLSLFPEQEIAACLVDGDCMTSAGILHGDYVIIDLAAQVADGDIAAVDSRRGRLVQYVHRVADGLLLVPATPVHAPVMLTWSDRPEITGKVIGIHRMPDMFIRL